MFFHLSLGFTRPGLSRAVRVGIDNLPGGINGFARLLNRPEWVVWLGIVFLAVNVMVSSQYLSTGAALPHWMRLYNSSATLLATSHLYFVVLEYFSRLGGTFAFFRIPGLQVTVDLSPEAKRTLFEERYRALGRGLVEHAQGVNLRDRRPGSRCSNCGWRSTRCSSTIRDPPWWPTSWPSWPSPTGGRTRG